LRVRRKRKSVFSKLIPRSFRERVLCKALSTFFLLIKCVVDF
jgi:hypothetical protein